MVMNNRKHVGAGGKYRFGFNSKENDGETVTTSEGTQDYGMRIYSPALGKFLSVDPIALNYPELSCYQYASNSPIVANDIDGKEMTFYEAQIEDNSLLKVMDHEELAERRYKEGRGYAIATVVVVDLVIFKGWLGRTLGFYFLGEAVGNGEKSYEAKSRGDVAISKEYADRSKDAYIGVALSYGPNILVKGTGAIYRNVKSAIVAVEEDGYAIVKDANGVNAGSAHLTDGQLNLSIRTNGTQLKGRGNEVFKELFNYVNNNFDKITKKTKNLKGDILFICFL